MPPTRRFLIAFNLDYLVTLHCDAVFVCVCASRISLSTPNQLRQSAKPHSVCPEPQTSSKMLPRLPKKPRLQSCHRSGKTLSRSGKTSGRFRKTLCRFRKTSPGSVARWPSGVHFGFTLDSLFVHLYRFVADARFLKTALPCGQELHFEGQEPWMCMCIHIYSLCPYF